METESLNFLTQMLSHGTPSGHEEPAQKVWVNYVKPFVSRPFFVGCYCDSMGNVWAQPETFGSFPDLSIKKVMVVGHCDEIGLMCSYATDEGYIHFVPIGGVDLDVLQGSRVKFVESGVVGVVGCRPTHLKAQDEEEGANESNGRKPRIRDFWIDIGASDKEEALECVPVGSMAYVHSEIATLRNGIIASHGIDDKVGAFVSAEVLKSYATRNLVESRKVCVVGVSSVQEEIGFCGAKVVAEVVKPDAAIVVDVGFASDTPDEDDMKTVGEASLGKGPLVHRGAAVNRVLLDCLLRAARQREIPIQMVPEPDETGTDADVVRLSGEGIPTAIVSVPVRYMHTPSELCNLADVQHTIDLIVEAMDLIGDCQSFAPFDLEP